MNRTPTPIDRKLCLLLAATSAVIGMFHPVHAVSSASDEPAYDTRKPWTRWWWPGSAVDPASLTAQLEQLQQSGIGGVEITPIYGARGYEDRYRSFLSESWVEALQHVVSEAQRLGLGVDMATGTGWPFGGPWVSEEDAAQRIFVAEGSLAHEPTGQRVKRAAPGGEGWVLDPFNSNALQRYLHHFDEAMQSLPTGSLRSHFHDSFEYYGASWTPTLPERFEALHGYALESMAEVLQNRSNPAALDDRQRRMLADYRSTLSLLHLDYLKTWNQWAREHGQLTRNQSHGAPANLLDLYAAADIPETEIFGATPFPIPGLRYDPGAVRQANADDLPEPLVSRFASSAAHVMGKNLVSCESATWLRDHWKVTLAFVKPELDRVLLDGINHIFFHGTVFSPNDANWPGWLFYASTQFQPNNPWWRDLPALTQYLQRIQKVLQSGNPDNDVLLYWPEADVWHENDSPTSRQAPVRQLSVHQANWILKSACGASARSLKESGVAFDYISDHQLRSSRVEDSHIVTPGGNPYRALVIPHTAYMPVDTLDHLLTLAENGATLIFESWPEDVPGWGHLEVRRARFHTLLSRLQALQCELPQRLIIDADRVAAVMRAGISAEPMHKHALECIRRDLGEQTAYFIANLSAQAVDGWIPLARSFEAVRIQDPLDGRSGVAAVRPNAREVYLQLQPGQTLLLHTLSHEAARPLPTWTYFHQGENGGILPIRGTWMVEFIEGGPTLPQAFQTEHYGSWTELCPDPEALRFAGTARYTITFSLPEVAADDWLLDLGDLRDSARVSINGQPMGTVWSLPFHLRIGSALRPGMNQLELEVTHIAANRIRDMDVRGIDWKIMHEINFVDIHYQPFDASDWKIEPAGLLTPLRLIPLRSIQP